MAGKKTSSDASEIEALKKQVAALTKKGKSGAKKPKDPNAPKRPPTAFFLFTDKHRASVKEEQLKEARSAAKKANKKITAEELEKIKVKASETAKRLGELWRAEKEGKTKTFLNLTAEAEKLKVAYNKIKPVAGAAKNVSADSDEEDSEDEAPAKPKKAAPVKKAAAKAAPVKKAAKAAPVDDSSDEDASDSESDSDDEAAPPPKKPAAKTTKAAPVKKASKPADDSDSDDDFE